jgi:hypothetical protein
MEVGLESFADGTVYGPGKLGASHQVELLGLMREFLVELAVGMLGLRTPG